MSSILSWDECQKKMYVHSSFVALQISVHDNTGTSRRYWRQGVLGGLHHGRTINRPKLCAQPGLCHSARSQAACCISCCSIHFHFLQLMSVS